MLQPVVRVLFSAVLTLGLVAIPGQREPGPQVAGADVWHTDADEPRALGYNEEFKSLGQLVSLYSPDAYRSSDHDPLLVRLQFGRMRSLWLPIVEVQRQGRPCRRCAAVRRYEQDHGIAGRGVVY